MAQDSLNDSIKTDTQNIGLKKFLSKNSLWVISSKSLKSLKNKPTKE